MKTILKQIVDEILGNTALSYYELEDVDWKGLERAVIREGVNKHSSLEAIKEAVIDLFDSVGYEEFGVIEVGCTIS
jgi:hypothetical protein